MHNKMSKTKRKFKVENEKSRCEYKFEARCQNINQLKRFSARCIIFNFFRILNVFLRIVGDITKNFDS